MTDARSSGTHAEHEPGARRRHRRLALHLALCGERPALGGRTFDLSDLQEVVIGRGAVAAIAPAGAPGHARCEVPDPTVSTRHVRLHLLPDDRARLEDLGSRNGTRLRGERTEAAEVGEGDWFIVGRSVFLLRAIDEGGSPDPFTCGEGNELRTFLPTLAETYATALKLAPSRVSLLLLAETGTGKEVLARHVHRTSGRTGSFVAVNCAALPETLVESELFGYRKGAFSDAREDRPGLVRSANGGTLLLDEVADLPLASQAKLLRVLQEGEVLSLGSTAPTKVDVRVIAATQRRLDDLVRAGKFRPDLVGRLAGYTLGLPPLRERTCDLGLLVAALLERHAGVTATDLRLSAEACIELVRRTWPLNVRELEQVLSAAIVLAGSGREIGASHLGRAVVDELAPELPADREALRERVIASLQRHRGNVSAVARDLGKARMQIQRWMQQFGIDATSFRL